MKKTNDGLKSNLTPGLDDSMFSPTGDDALLIEGDDNSSKESTGNQVEEASDNQEVSENEVEEAPEIQEITEPVETEATEEVKEEIEVQSVEEEQPKESKKSKKAQEKAKSKTGKKGSALPVFIVLLFAVCGGVWYYFSRPKPQPQTVVQQPKEAPVVVEKPQVKNIPPEPMVIDTVPPAGPVAPPARIATKLKVPRGWVIGYRATPDEAVAISTVAELTRVDSLPCSYYWIGDVREGEKLFKVYVGPYSTKSEAEAVLPSIQVKRADAYVYTEDNNGVK